MNDKKFKDTKLGHWLKEKAPKILDKVGDLLPDDGVLGIVKNLISSDPDMTPEMKAEFHRMENEYSLELLKDVQSARSREIEYVKATGHTDYFMNAFGALMGILFAYTIYVSSQGTIPAEMREIFIEGRAAVRDIVIAIAGFYWGSSRRQPVAKA